MTDFPRAGAAGSVFGSIAEPFRGRSAGAVTGRSTGVDDMLSQLRQLRALGIIDSSTESDIEAAIISGDAGLILRWVSELATSEAEGAFYGLDGDVRALREGLAGSIGATLPVEGVVRGAIGIPLPGERDERRAGYVRNLSTDVLVPTPAPMLYAEDEYDDPNLLMGAEEALMYGRDGLPLNARIIVGQTSFDGGNVGMTPDQVTGLLAALNIPVLPSIDNVAMPGEDPIGADGNSIDDDLILNEPGKTVPDENDLPRMVVYRRDFANFPDDLAFVLAHEAGHVIDMLLPEESQARLYAMMDQAAELFDEVNVDGVIERYSPEHQPFERIGDAIRTYMLYPNWLKTYYPELADAIAREVNAAPALQGIIQFN